jgi:hypothetical protein
MRKITLLLAGIVFATALPAFAHEKDHGSMQGREQSMDASMPESMKMEHEDIKDAHGHGVAQNYLNVQIIPSGELKAGQLTKMLMKLTKTADGAPVASDDIKIAHTRRIHLLVIDPTLSDYHHIHPQPTGNSGEWAFDFTPKMDSSYRMWTDVIPTDTNKQEYIKSDIGSTSITSHRVDKTTSALAKIDNYSYSMNFDKPLTVGQASMGKVVVTNKDGKPATNLEPVMGAFAHIVAFSEDGNSILHIHPMGAEPKSDSERGGPALEFHIEPEKAGFVKMFVQTRIDGQDKFAPFGVNVEGVQVETQK